MKKIRLLLTILAVSVCSLHSAMAQEQQEVTVTVTLLESNSLGDEVLTALAGQGFSDASVTMVENLTVTGPMGDADWTILKSFSSLKTLDLSGAICESVPNDQFHNTSCNKLVEVVLPNNLKTIGSNAFGNQDYLVSITIPTGVETIGSNAFDSCNNLEDIVNGWPVGATTIPGGCFSGCYKLNPFTIPEGVTIIGSSAFSNCYLFKSSLPSTIKEIGSQAFHQTSSNNSCMENEDIVIPEGATVGYNAFSYTKIKSITFPTNYYNAYDGAGIVNYCNNLTDVTFKSPTVVEKSSYFISSDNVGDITLHVPSYLVNAYKQDANWLLYKSIQGFETSTVSDWTVQSALNLNANSRIEGDANMFFSEKASLKINGTTAQVFGNFTTSSDISSTSYDIYEYWYYTNIISGCNNVSVTGDYKHRIKTYGKKWYFLCLPFDFKVGDIVTEDGVKYAIRYYDGASRASSNTASGNWKDYTENDVISAGTGFILQTSQSDYKGRWVTFKALANNSRNNVFKAEEITMSLNKYACENAANKSWNYIGNPWQAYYNIRKLNYTAPISVRDYNYDTYNAYSPTDDDFALMPNQGFFVQCPDALTEIGFPIDGRQLTSEINSQNATRAADRSNRQLFDLQISAGDLKDKTRLVINDQAMMDYEIGCDASKFMSEGTAVAQIYSLGCDGTKYAINERPANSGAQVIGILFASDGQYTLSAIRNDIGQVILTDKETGIKTDLQQNDYSFDAKAGIAEDRFTIAFGAGLTGIHSIKNAVNNGMEVFTLDGKKAGNSTDGLKKGVYVVRQGQDIQKIIVK